MKIDDLKRYIELYDMEKYLFDVIGSEASKRGYLTFEGFYKICMWKSARQKQKYISVKNRNEVEAVTRSAFAEQDERKRMEKLCGLSGVGIPTASAILSVIFPEKYAVIDIRCLEMLREKFGYKISKQTSLKSWVEYLNIMRNLARENAITPRKLDMALFAMHREKLMNEDYRNLYR